MESADEALQRHGFTGTQLLGLARKAADDALRRHGAFLDEERFEDLTGYMLEVGCRYAPRFEPGHGIGISTFLYRRMRIRYTDWLRLTMGDTRYATSGRRPSEPTFPFHEVDAASVEHGYELVEAVLSAERQAA